MIHLSRQDYDQIVSYARDQVPNEACGLLAGEKKGDEAWVRQVYYLKNTDASPEHFSMDPAEQFAAIRDMRQHGWIMLGNFHSHPATPSRPSEEDKRLAFDPTLRYMILSLADTEPVLRSFFIRQGNQEREELSIE